MNAYLATADIEMANKHMKSCSTSLDIREKQIKVNVSSSLPTKWLKLKTDYIKVAEDVEQLELS